MAVIDIKPKNIIKDLDLSLILPKKLLADKKLRKLINKAIEDYCDQHQTPQK